MRPKTVANGGDFQDAAQGISYRCGFVCAVAELHVRESPSRWHGLAEKKGTSVRRKTRDGKNAKIHMIIANAVTPVVYDISRGNLHDGPQGRELLEKLDGRPFRKSQNGKKSRILIDKAYEGDRTRKTVRKQGF